MADLVLLVPRMDTIFKHIKDVFVNQSLWHFYVYFQFEHCSEESNIQKDTAKATAEQSSAINNLCWGKTLHLKNLEICLSKTMDMLHAWIHNASWEIVKCNIFNSWAPNRQHT